MHVGPERRANLLEYAPWMMRDYLTSQGPSTAIVVLLIGFLSLMPMLAPVMGDVSLGDVPEQIARQALRALVPILAFLGVFFGTNGIVSNDRKTGFYRFLFAKPVSPPLYYATTFVVYGIGLLLVTLALLGVWSLVIRPMFPVQMFAVVLIVYLAYGGIGFLLSATWRFDWISLVTVLLVAGVGWATWGDEPGIRGWIVHALPPVHRMPEIYALVARDGTTPIPWTALVWSGGYGLACFMAGMIVIRKRPLGTG